jgi:hypothetical protein
MKSPSPLLLLMGGGALINVALMVNGLKAPAWARHGGMAILIALGITSLVLALRMVFAKKPERPKYQPRRRAPVELAPEARARREQGRAGGGEPPPPPPA